MYVQIKYQLYGIACREKKLHMPYPAEVINIFYCCIHASNENIFNHFLKLEHINSQKYTEHYSQCYEEIYHGCLAKKHVLKLSSILVPMYYYFSQP